MGKYFKMAMFFTSFLPLWITILFIDILNIIRLRTELYTEKISILMIVLGIFISIFMIKKALKQISPIHISRNGWIMVINARQR